MELVWLGMEACQSVAERAASYKPGQAALRQVDRALWGLEKCARWAVPPPLEPDERPQPELIRPLPWLFFLAVLVSMRLTRETISLLNLIRGKPPLRSADVVTFIQSKRRYLRTLKYQGNRMMRARAGTTQSGEPWYAAIKSLFELAMCFKDPRNYGNNNTTTHSNNDELLVVKRDKSGRIDTSPVASGSDCSMERLIEKMMLDIDADSDADSSYTLTNATSVRSEKSESSGTEQDTVCHNETLEPKTFNTSTPEKLNSHTNNASIDKEHITTNNTLELSEIMNDTTKADDTKCTLNGDNNVTVQTSIHIKAISNIEETNNLLYSEKMSHRSSSIEPPKKEQKIANGRTLNSVTNKRKVNRFERLESDAPAVRVTPADAIENAKEMVRLTHQNAQ